MDAARFDTLIRTLVAAASRRQLLRAAAAGATSLVAGWELAHARSSRRPGRRDRTCRGLRGGVLATFTVAEEAFRVWVTNAQTIAQLLALQAGTSEASIPNGRLRRGAGRGRHNAPWHWHLDPQDIALAEVTTEVCDGLPSSVEAHHQDVIAQVGRYCPWSARLVALVDCR